MVDTAVAFHQFHPAPREALKCIDLGRVDYVFDDAGNHASSVPRKYRYFARFVSSDIGTGRAIRVTLVPERHPLPIRIVDSHPALGFMVVSIAAMAFPYRLKDVFESPPVNARVGGVPWMTIVGALSFVALAIMAWAFLTDPSAGLNGHPGLIWMNIIIFFSGLVIYAVAKAVSETVAWTSRSASRRFRLSRRQTRPSRTRHPLLSPMLAVP
jgi:hypothetical protein